MITKTLFKDINQGDGNFEEDWEFAITEVIVNLEDKINAKKGEIQHLLNELDELGPLNNQVTTISSLPLQRNQDNFVSKSFDYNTSSFQNGNRKKKTVKFEDERVANRTQNYNFKKFLTSEISDSIPVKQEKAKFGQIKKQSANNPSGSKKNYEERKSSEFNFEEMANNTDWVEDEMNVLLGLDRNEEEEIPKTLMPEM